MPGFVATFEGSAQGTSCITHLVSSADPEQFCMTYHGSTETSLCINPHHTPQPNGAQSQQ